MGYIRNEKGYIKICARPDNYTNIAISGHRPNYLPGRYDWRHPGNVRLGRKIKECLEKLIKEDGSKKFRFICGAGLGVDQMAFEGLWELKKELHPEYEIIIRLAIPFKDQPKEWINELDCSRYRRHKRLADEIVYVDRLKGYDRCKEVEPGKYHWRKNLIRNEYMVDQSKFLFAVWSGWKKSGTGHTIRYAIKKGKKTIILKI